jgi:hypothetical protein
VKSETIILAGFGLVAAYLYYEYTKFPTAPAGTTPIYPTPSAPYGGYIANGVTYLFNHDGSTYTS